MQIAEAGQGSGPGLLASYGYDSLGQLTSFAYGGSSYGQSYAYDGIGRLATLGSTFPDAGRNDIEKLTFGPDSRIRVRANSNNAFDWQAPQGVSQGYGVNGLDQIAWAGITRFSYDGAGRLASDGTSSYGYSVYDQLTSMSGAAALGHDPLQRLASVTTASATTEFVYDGAMITEELNGSGAVLRRYVPGPDGTPLVWYEGSGETDRRWMLKDHQGSVTAVANTTQSSGLIALNTYDAYGVGGGSNAGRFQYAGYPWIPETGLYETLARSYSPTLGRFLSTDPTGYADGLNWYAYTHSDPVDGVDPDGLAGCAEQLTCNQKPLESQGSADTGVPTTTEGEVTVDGTPPPPPPPPPPPQNTGGLQISSPGSGNPGEQGPGADIGQTAITVAEILVTGHKHFRRFGRLTLYADFGAGPVPLLSVPVPAASDATPPPVNIPGPPSRPNQKLLAHTGTPSPDPLPEPPDSKTKTFYNAVAAILDIINNWMNN